MNVTVENTIDVTADVTVAQIEAYLRRTGWKPGLLVWGARQWKKRNIFVEVPGNEAMPSADIDISECVYSLASHERRLPGDVLLNIATEQA